ncbi:MAG: MATE family efflux transporter [Lachnospiraceae bacterium]|nr:MATE family efflux transporter [Lachnospiraceae bacterium]
MNNVTPREKDPIRLSDHFTYGRILRFALPSMVMFVFTSIYTVVDGFFISNYAGKEPFAAVNLIMPFLMILGTVGFMFGTGGAAIVSKTLGEGDPDRANRYFSEIVEANILFGAILSAAGFILMEPVSLALGADEAMLPYCVLYGRICAAGNLAFMLQNAFQSFFVVAEKPHLGLFFTVASGVTNMVLDFLFVGVFKWGVAGAAIATVMSQVVGGVLPIFYFAAKNSSLLTLRSAKIEWKMIAKTAGNGSSELMSNISSSIVSIAYNFQLLKFAGSDGVAAYGVLMYVCFIFIAIFIGYSVGTAPIVGYHYGAGNQKEMHNVLKMSLTMMSLFGIVMLFAAELLAGPLSKMYVGYDADLYNLTVHAFRLFSFSFLVAGVNIYSSSFFTALNNGAISAAISFLRTLVFQLLSVLLLPLILGLDGIWFANLVADLGALCVTLYFLISRRKKYGY